MKVVALGADHAGFVLKEDLKAWLRTRGYEVRDFGTHSLDSVDYPDYAARVGQAVTTGDADRGVLVCGSGLGMAIAANKVPGVRAVTCFEPELARLSREHNDANVLTLGGRFTDKDSAIAILAVWLDTPFAGGRHAGRVAKVSALEEKGSDAPAR